VEAKIEKLRQQMNSVRSNKEYSALLVEVNTFKVEKDKLEEEALLAMGKVEGVAADLTALEAQVAEQAKLAKVAGTHAEIASDAAIARTVADYLAAQNLPPRLVAAPHPLLAGVVWPEGWQVESRRARGDDRIGLAVAFCGIAETGSLVLLSGPESPTTLNFLPDDFLCLLPDNRIVPRMEDAWALLRAERGSLPRATNLITGPSRTADVEQTIQLGAHGPRRLHVILRGSTTEG